MSIRASLPKEAVTITPGYSWRLDLDVKFDGQRPNDWSDWTVRMLIWGKDYSGFKLSNDDGVSFEPVAGLPGEAVPVVIPVLRLSRAQSAALASIPGLNYLIDLTAPGSSEPEDYFAGPMALAFAPPLGLIS